MMKNFKLILLSIFLLSVTTTMVAQDPSAEARKQKARIEAKKKAEIEAKKKAKRDAKAFEQAQNEKKQMASPMSGMRTGEPDGMQGKEDRAKKASKSRVLKKYNYYELIDGKDNELTSRKYSSIIPINERYEHDKYTSLSFTGFYEAKKGNLHGILDSIGNEVIPVIYPTFKKVGQLVYHVGKDKKHGLMAITGEVIFPLEFDKPFRNVIGKPLFTSKGGKEGAVSREGEIIIPFEYDLIRWSAYHTYIKVWKGDLLGLVDVTGEKIQPVEFDEIKERPNKNWVIKKNNKTGLWDSEFNELLAPLYDEIKVGKTFGTVRIGNKNGIISPQGEIILPCVYTTMEFLGHSLIVVRKENELYGIVSINGETIVSPKFESYHRVSRNNIVHFIAVTNKKDGKKALFHTVKKELVTPFIYDKLKSKRHGSDSNWTIDAERDGLKGSIDKNGIEQGEFIPIDK